MKKRMLALALFGAGVLVTACGTASEDSGGGAPNENGFSPPDLPALEKLGEPEGELSVLAWPGYAEDGSTDPRSTGSRRSRRRAAARSASRRSARPTSRRR